MRSQLFLYNQTKIVQKNFKNATKESKKAAKMSEKGQKHRKGKTNVGKKPRF